MKNISILFVLSLLLAYGESGNNCDQNELDLIDSSEPHYLLKASKCYSSRFISGKPIIDGRLDEDVWGSFNSNHDNSFISSFIQEEPDNLQESKFKTSVKIFHDENNIYIGAKLFDSNPDSIRGALSRKDDWDRAFSDQADWFSIEFDSKHDHQSGYLFAVNASGVQSDAILYLDSDYDIEYNSIWKSEVSADEEGWTIEMAIPFKTLNITQIENPWGVNIHRYVYRYNEYSSWVTFERDTPGIASQFGHIFGFKEFNVKRFIGIKPYALCGMNKTNNTMLMDDQLYKDSFNRLVSNKFEDRFFGLDANLRLSSSSYIDLTVNPDFGQVEMDPEFINLSYYEVYLPEKRTFFNESVSMFELPIEIFYSRRIGASDDSLDSNIDYALKYIGSSISGWNIGSIAAKTSDRDKSRSYLVNRVSKDILGGNSIMGLSSSSLLDESKIYSTFSFDNIYYLHNNLILDYQYVRSVNDNISGNGHNLNLEYDSSFPFTFSYDMESYDKNFDINKVGYNERNNLKNHRLAIGYKSTNPSIDMFRKFRWDLTYNTSKNFDNLKIANRLSVVARYYGARYNKFSAGYIIDNEHYDDYYMYDYELNENGPAFLIPKTHGYFTKYNSDTKRKVHYTISLGSSFSANRDRLLETRINISSNLNQSSSLKLGFEQMIFNSSFDFLETVDDDENQDISHYIFSNTNGWNNRYTASFEKYFNKDISLKIFSEYFIHYNKFGGYREWSTEQDSLISSDFIYGDGTPELPPLYTQGSMEPETYEIYGQIETEQYLNPNYYVGFYPRYTSINLNFSFKWEYDSNSDFYIVFRASKSVNGKIFKSLNDLLRYSKEDDWTEKYFDNSIYIKFNHWFEL